MTTMNHTKHWDAAQQQAFDWIITHNHEIRSTMTTLARHAGQGKADALLPHVADQWRDKYQADGQHQGKHHIEQEFQGIRDLIALGQDGGPLLDRAMRHTAHPQEIWDAIRLTIGVIEIGDRQQVSTYYPQVMSMEWTAPAHQRIDSDLLLHQARASGQDAGLHLRERFGEDKPLLAQIESVSVERTDVFRDGFHRHLLLAIGSRSEPAMAMALRLAEHGTSDPDRLFPDSPGVLLSWMEQQPAELLRSQKRFIGALSRWAISGLDHAGEPLPGDLREKACSLLGRTAHQP
jgi:hypothetical protein